MKKSLLTGAVFSALALTIGGCTDGVFDYGESGTGTITPSVGIDAAVASSRSSRAEASEVRVADLAINLTSADGQKTYSWASVSEFSIDQKFPVGEYLFEVSYGDENTEGFESPYFYGSENIIVRENETTPVNVTATLANAMVSIDYTDNLKDYMTSWSSSLHSPGGAYIEYAQDESRPAYIRPGQVEIYVNYVKPNGKGAQLRAASFNAVARRHYHVTIDLEQGAGTAILSIIFDEATEEEPIEIELSDELESAPAPTIAPEGFDNGASLNFVQGTAMSSPVKFNILAKGGLAAVKLTTVSKSLASQGWPEEIDLLKATSEQQSLLESLGFFARGIFRNPEKMAVIDLAKVSEHIEYLENGGSNTSTFTVLVEDILGQVSEPISVSFVAGRLEIGISNPGLLIAGDDKLEFDLNYNGGDPTNNVTIEYFNSRGTWTEVAATYVKSTDNCYRATITTPNIFDDVTIRAKAGNLTSESLTVKRSEVSINATIAENDVFATHATAVCSVTSEQPIDTDKVLAAVNVMISKDGVNYTTATTTYDQATKSIRITGLEPGTAYTAKVRLGSKNLNEIQAIPFTTETAAQIPNGNLDADATIVSSRSNWENYAFEGWGTNNTMTTSQGSGAFANYAYDAISGTIPTTDSKSGSAVIIRSVGWGSGNTAVGSTGSSGKTKFRDAGLLHLGATRESRPDGYGQNDNNGCGPVNVDDLECGIDFASRPSTLSFWYKYSPKNPSDKGFAEIWVKDAAGNIIASGTLSLEQSDSYVKKTISLEYAAGAPKAGKLYVRFQSTSSDEFLIKNDANFSGPGFGNTSRGTYMGSQLYIDEVELSY